MNEKIAVLFQARASLWISRNITRNRMLLFCFFRSGRTRHHNSLCVQDKVLFSLPPTNRHFLTVSTRLAGRKIIFVLLNTLSRTWRFKATIPKCDIGQVPEPGPRNLASYLHKTIVTVSSHLVPSSKWTFSRFPHTLQQLLQLLLLLLLLSKVF
jgi:hypothetical protein